MPPQKLNYICTPRVTKHLILTPSYNLPPSILLPIKSHGLSFYLLRFDFKEVTDWELLCQLRFLWLMNQLLICFSCKPVSSTSFALSSSCMSHVSPRTFMCQLKEFSVFFFKFYPILTVGYGHFECCCHQFFSTVVVSPGNFPALLFLSISSLTSSILDLKPCVEMIVHFQK